MASAWADAWGFSPPFDRRPLWRAVGHASHSPDAASEGGEPAPTFSLIANSSSREHPPVEPPLLPWAEKACGWIVRGAVAIALLLAVSNLAVWLLPPLQVVASWPNVMVVRVNNALAMMMAALSLLAWHLAGERPKLRPLALLAGAVPIFIGGLTTLEYMTGFDIGLDQWIVPGTFPGDRGHAFVVAPGRMSLNAALSLFLLGTALVSLDGSVQLGRGLRFPLSPWFALLAALPSGCGLVGYVVGSGAFTGLLRSTNILWHAALCLFLLSMGVLAVRPHRPPVSWFFATGTGGVLLRWLLPGSVGLLVALGWGIWQGGRVGWVKEGEGTALMLYGGLILLSALMVAASRAVTRQEANAENAATASREAAERFRFLAETVSLQVWTARPNGELDFANQEVAQYFGIDIRSDVLGHAWTQFVHPDDLPVAQRAWQDALTRGQRYETEFRLRRHDGEHRWFLGRAQPMRDAGQIVSWFGTNTDIHDLKTAQREAEAASRAKDDFLAALSHELRTPLTPVLLCATALRRDERLPADVRADLAMMERNIQLEGRLIDDLLDLTRITRGKLPLRTEHCDVHALLGHSLEIVRDEAKGKGVTLALDLAARNCAVTGDPARLQQVFWNLLRNAVKFTPADGRIDIRSCESSVGDRFVLEICDTGFGFAPEQAERLFLPFEQESRDGHHRFGGLGLGLAIARAIVNLHGGRICAASAGPGKGATFTVDLPFAEGGATLASASEAGASNAPVAPHMHTILLVEDDESTLAVMTKLLRKAGHTIVGAGGLSAALTAAGHTRFDLLICDLGLPDGSGLEVLRQLRARDPQLTAIALSGYGMEDDLARSRDAGFHLHLVKPIDFDQLAQIIREL